ncbi:ATP-dependent helicase [Tanticharoenia sakaeratensis NBRC 103193]|uniref:ATP-dependent helicase n=2 Tax=Tanticharoenia TaxID=444052 RepID=A0A0D6MK36_9PROT|nr:ligase-associated DNA damage response DEXH box helicase [Tanticharoenia sakaeratensis]GAN53800.1 ATP-dependent helicase [Tanticharoenia sakaeratensis NBRC 103193]GBQ22330.1 DEAD/DEAH box helicase [Tanticharoenia sakaeratensis NBRC 103193]
MTTDLLPDAFATWFAARGWTPRPHQRAMLDAAASGQSALLVAPTGGGKTLAGFLPSLVDLAKHGSSGKIHTVYVSPLKALAQDIARNLIDPIDDMGLPIRIETRTGDTSQTQRKRQREIPPDILLTTPESLALLLSLPEADEMFEGLSCVILDEIHAIAGTKRGDQLALCTARLSRLAPDLRLVGLSATVAHPDAIAAYIAPNGDPARVRRITGAQGAPPEIGILVPEPSGPRDRTLPWSGHMGLFAAPAILAAIKASGMTIVFVNTRAQAELLFDALWRHNDETLPIAMHHGSLDPEQRRRVEDAMAAGRLRAVVATSSLDLGIDWAGVDQVIQVGAPKGVSRLLQRIGRANHRMDAASRAILVPANRFEVLECEAAREGVAEMALDGDPPRPGGLDVLAQHLLGMACSAPFLPDDLYAEVRTAAPYARLSRQDFDDTLRFVADGGYALQAYDRHRKLFTDAIGLVWVRDERVARQYRMNIGTIVEAPMLRVRQRRGGVLGEVEEGFAAQLVPGDTFLFGGRLLRFEGLRETAVEVTPGTGGEPRVPIYEGGRLPLSTNLADRVRRILHDPDLWPLLPVPVQEWLALQARRSRLPGEDDLLVETFPRGGRWYLVAYCFEGRNAHQTLGMLLTRRLERAGAGPLGFVTTDYVLACWCAHEPQDMAALFAEDMLGDDLDAWMADSAMLRRTFRTVAVIAGLIERKAPGAEKNRRQVTINSDLLYDVLRQHEPDHVLLRATRADAAAGLTDLGRIAHMLRRAAGRTVHVRLPRVSPLAVPVLLEIGRERIAHGAGEEDLLAEAEQLIAEGMSESA